MEMLQSDFIQNVSHEFKTPLASIEGYATLLNGAALPGELNVYSRHILESARQLSVLTGNILKLSKLENQGIISQKESFSLDEQIRQALLSLERVGEDGTEFLAGVSNENGFLRFHACMSPPVGKRLCQLPQIFQMM